MRFYFTLVEGVSPVNYEVLLTLVEGVRPVSLSAIWWAELSLPKHDITKIAARSTSV